MNATADSSDIGGKPKAQKGKRHGRRTPVFLKSAVVSKKGSEFLGYAGDISVGGMFINTSTPRKVGDELELVFTLPLLNEDISVTVRVMWVSGQGPFARHTSGMGVMFVDIDTEAVQKIHQYVATYTGAK